MNGFKIDVDEVDDNFIYSASHKICTQIVKDTDEATYKKCWNKYIENILRGDE